MSDPQREPGLISVEGRVLILAPTSNDAAITADFLKRSSMVAEICRDIPELCQKMEAGCGSLLLAEETLAGAAMVQLVEALSRQPAWSDLPIIIITSGGEVSQMRLRRLGVFGPGGNVMLLERPFRPATLVSTVEVALRARRRQREVQGLFQKLEASEERVMGILDSISDAFITIDRDWRISYVNSSYVAMVRPLFQSADELLGHTLWEKFPDIVNSDVGRFYRRTMETQESGTFELFYPPLDAWLEVRAFPSPKMLSLYVRDISERKRQEAAVAELTHKVQEQARLFDTILSNMADLAYIFDRDGRLLYANKPLLELWQKPLAEMMGKNLVEMDYPGDLAEKLNAQIAEVIATRRGIRDEAFFSGADGVEEIHDYIFNPVVSADGEVVAVAGTTRLVTEHRRAESARRQLAAIVESSDDAIVSKDLNGIIQTWNQGAQRLFGYTSEETVGNSINLLIPPELYDEEKEILRRIRQGDRIQHYETTRRCKDGRLVTVSLTVSPIRDREGRVTGASKIARDVTEWKLTEMALKAAKDAAESANRSKDHFLAVLSHELRTPLTPVLMTASALEMDPIVPAALRADMAMIRRNVELETKLIDDLLDLSRITSGKLALHVRSVDLNQTVREVCSICEPQVSEKKIDLKIDLDAYVGHVNADPARLQQVLWNILKNAIKFTPNGGTIQVTTAPHLPGKAQFSISDSGVGMDSQVLPKIFDAFEQGDEKITRQFGGLGLGLAITKALVELHEGKIRAESEGAGRGSTFTVEWPTSKVEKPVEGSSNAERASGDSLRILVVEDHQDTAAMLARLLGVTGYQVTVANSAASALETAARQPFDLVVSDIGLPDSTGYDLMRGLRARHEIKGIAMSGYGMEEDIRKSLDAGFTEHLVKPVNLLSLEQAIRRIAAQLGD